MTDTDFIWDAAFHSGMSSVSDLRGAIMAKVPVGVVATALTLTMVLRTIPNYIREGGKVFVDSGAFNAFRLGLPVDWGKVVMTYDRLTDSDEDLSGLSIVCPDVIGDQDATVALWRAHAGDVERWVERGARVIVPLQVGTLSAGELLDEAKRIFGTPRLCAGIPSNLEAMGPEDCATLRHDDFHLLGRVVVTPELGEKLKAILANNPNATLTSDANWMRSRLKKISQALSDTKRPEFGPGKVSETRRSQALAYVLVKEAYASRAVL